MKTLKQTNVSVLKLLLKDIYFKKLLLFKFP